MVKIYSSRYLECIRRDRVVRHGKQLEVPRYTLPVFNSDKSVYLDQEDYLILKGKMIYLSSCNHDIVLPDYGGVSLHRWVFREQKIPSKCYVDHLYQDIYDNRKKYLRIVTPTINSINRSDKDYSLISANNKGRYVLDVPVDIDEVTRACSISAGTFSNIDVARKARNLLLYLLEKFKPKTPEEARRLGRRVRLAFREEYTATYCKRTGLWDCQFIFLNEKTWSSGTWLTKEKAEKELKRFRLGLVSRRSFELSTQDYLTSYQSFLWSKVKLTRGASFIPYFSDRVYLSKTLYGENFEFGIFPNLLVANQVFEEFCSHFDSMSYFDFNFNSDYIQDYIGKLRVKYRGSERNCTLRQKEIDF